MPGSRPPGPCQSGSRFSDSSARAGRCLALGARLPDFWRLLELRLASQFADGLFQAGLAGALLFNPERPSSPLAIAGAFAVLFLPYSLLGPFAGALMDRWDRRLVLVAANVGRVVSVAFVGICLALGARDVLVLCGALVVNGLARFVSSGLSAALPHVVPREQVVTMNSIASAVGAVAAFLGANFMLVPRAMFGSGDTGAASTIFLVIVPLLIALLLSLRFADHVLGPDDTRRAIHGSVLYAVITGWLHGVRTVLDRPTVAATLSGLAAHRMVFGINSLLVLLLVRSRDCGRGLRAGQRDAVRRRGRRRIVSGEPGHAARGAPLGPVRHRQRRAGDRRRHRDRRCRPAGVGAGGGRLPARRAGPGGQAVRRHRDSDRRGRRAARTRVRGAGFAVLGGVHRRDHRWRRASFRATATPPR